MSGLAQSLGREPQVRTQAPGRVNLIGEHTDYNDGFVLPTPIPQQTTVELAARDDPHVRVASANVADGAPAEYELGEEAPRGHWGDYVQGVTHVLLSDGHRLAGFDAYVHSDVPIGGGLSSSAALGVALQRALRERFDLVLDDVQIARNAQRAENEFVGAQVGIMDPLVASVGRLGEALFVDTRDLTTLHLPIPVDLQLVVVDSGTSHRVAGGEYNQRRRECEQAAVRLGVRSLRELGVDALDRVAALPDPLARRARHVITENQRVLDAVAAMTDGELDTLGRLLAASHASLRDDYEVSTPAIDALVAALSEQPGVLGARITGGGFGGSVVAFAVAGRGDEAAERAADRYARETGQRPLIVVPPPREVPLAEQATARNDLP